VKNSLWKEIQSHEFTGKKKNAAQVLIIVLGYIVEGLCVRGT